MQKIWISGAGGQIGKAINRMVDKLEYEILDTDVEELDITDTDEVLRYGEMNRPDVIINCSGITNTQVCEDNPKLAFRVNALGARNLSIVSKKIEAKLVQVSTDDVFDGKSTKPYNEFDAAQPITIYGKSKLAGENYVKEFTSKHFIIRSTWVYGEGENFVNGLIRRADAGDKLSIAMDQFGSPTSAHDLAKFILHIIKTSEYGTYHATNQGVCSRYDFAKEILRLTGREGFEVNGVPTALSDFSSVRPPYAVLDNFIISIIDVYDFPHWRDSLKEYIKGGSYHAETGE